MKYAIIAIGVLLTAAAQVLVKFTSFHEFWSKKFMLFIGSSILAYCCAFLAQTYLMRLFPLSKVVPAMSIATMLAVFVCGVWLFNEQMGVKQIVGILLGATSIYLILS
ncbi:MAG: EamA family transporter [Prevotellaceae bacterium]|jgi:drug/metabolite transporter (DMT)-like permease|nr:EamA family transporter [Prevotellaceae bacterium]